MLGHGDVTLESGIPDRCPPAPSPAIAPCEQAVELGGGQAELAIHHGQLALRRRLAARSAIFHPGGSAP